MTLVITEDRKLDQAMVEAVEWLVRLSSGEATDEDARALEQWRAQDPANDKAFRTMASLRPVARALKKAPKLDRRAVLTGGGGLIAAIGAFMVVRPPLHMWPSLAELMADHRTGPGQRYAFAPVNGVKVEMNSRTSVSLVDDGAGIELIDGEAFVTINRAGVFVVKAGRARAMAENAALNVQTLGSAVRVSCIAGRVTCERGSVRETLGPREELTLSADGTAVRRVVAVAQLAAWRQGLLVFEATPLVEVVEQFNRYRSSPIVLANSDMAQRPVSGVFYTDQIDPAITQLQQLLNLHLRELPGGVAVLS